MLARIALFTLLVTSTLLADSYEYEVMLIASPATANDINNHGQVVGASGFDGFLRDSGGLMTTIHYPGASSTHPTNIDESGNIIGYYTLGNPEEGAPPFGFHRSNEGIYTTITVPGAQATFLWGMNNAGDIVGMYVPAPPEPPFIKPFLRESNGVITDLEVPGAVGANCVGINDHGVISGTFVDTDFTVHGYVLEDGVYSVIDYPGATLSAAGRLNNCGKMNGGYSDENSAPGQEDASFLMTSDGVFSDFSFPGAAVTLLRGINDHGDLSGMFENENGPTQAFIARPACPADVTRDGAVDVEDLVEVILNWGSTPGCAADATRDGTVNVEDLVEVVLNWGSCE